MSDQTYPAAPWDMHGQLWLSLFRVAHAVDELRPAGVYGVALVRYEDPSPLTYGELLVAHTVKKPVKGVTITDIWVDSPASVAGGRELWAIPKGLCEFDHRDHGGDAGADVLPHPAGEVADEHQGQRPATGDVVGGRREVEQQARDEAEDRRELRAAGERRRDDDEQDEVGHDPGPGEVREESHLQHQGHGDQRQGDETTDRAHFRLPSASMTARSSQSGVKPR